MESRQLGQMSGNIDISCKWLGIPTYATLEEPLACYVSKVFSLLPDKHRSKKDPAKISLSYLLPN